eukprot:3936415-Rhodomonas_salina.2
MSMILSRGVAATSTGADLPSLTLSEELRSTPWKSSIEWSSGVTENVSVAMLRCYEKCRALCISHLFVSSRLLECFQRHGVFARRSHP